MVQTKPLKTSRSPVKGPQSVCEGPGDRCVLGHGRVGDRNEIPRYDVFNSVPNCEEGGVTYQLLLCFLFQRDSFSVVTVQVLT